VPLLDIPARILDKYSGLAEGDKLLPVPCYKTAKYLLKRIVAECAIDKHVTWHQSRHTYATEICLSNGVPIESLAKMMGHRNIRTTQIYAKITHEKLSRDADLLANRLNGIEQFQMAAI
jgi:integrase